MTKATNNALDNTVDIADGLAEQREKVSFPLMAKYNETTNTALRSGELFSKRVQEVNQQIMTSFQDAISANAEAAKAMLDARTAKDFFAVQSEWIRSSVERAMKDATKFSDWSMKLAAEAAEPAQDYPNAVLKALGEASSGS